MFIKIEEVLTQEDIQVRVSTDQDMINDIAEAVEKGEAVRPVLVTQLQNGKYLILDGHHRFQALKQAGRKEIEVIVNSRVKSMAEAVAAGVAFNAKNGLRLTREDIKRSIELLLRHDPKITPQEIMNLVKRSKSTVYEIMNELSRAGKIQLPETRTGADGKERPTTYEKNIRCGNPRCKKFVSAVYVEQLEKEGREDGDWIRNETSGKWYCSEDCETEAELEAEADAVLKANGEDPGQEEKRLPSAAVPAVRKNEAEIQDPEPVQDAEDAETETSEPSKGTEEDKILEKAGILKGSESRASVCPVCGNHPRWCKTPAGHILRCSDDFHYVTVSGGDQAETLEKWNRAFSR